MTCALLRPNEQAVRGLVSGHAGFLMLCRLPDGSCPCISRDVHAGFGVARLVLHVCLLLAWSVKEQRSWLHTLRTFIQRARCSISQLLAKAQTCTHIQVQ